MKIIIILFICMAISLKLFAQSYVPGAHLLNTNRGEVLWGQMYNNSWTCNPSYNMHCPTDGVCECGHKPAGCAAVAMGQIMWYWQWPNSSSYRTYNWSSMPNILTVGSGTEIPKLLRDCGDASDMTYWCSGAWATMNDVVDAFKNTFHYQGVKKHLRKDWEYGSAWEDLIRSEINVGRPVLYRGGNVFDVVGDIIDISEIGNVHYFVIDGFNATNPHLFHVNWGQKGDWDQKGDGTGEFTLDNLLDYSANAMVITGISPTYEEVIPSQIDITDVPYTTVTGTKTELAQQTISLPAPGKTLIVENGGNLTLGAGKSVKLNYGFHAKAGSLLKAKTDVSYTLGEMDINVPTWYNAFSPNGDGIDDEFCIDVENANSWEFQVFDSYTGAEIFQSAGTISNNVACMWDGSGAYCNMPAEGYACIVRFKNNFGRGVEKAYTIYVVGCTREKSKTISLDGLIFRNPKNGEKSFENKTSINNGIEIYPNPNNGIFYIKSNILPKSIIIYTILGQIVYQESVIISNIHQIDLGKLPNGVYLVKLAVNNEVIEQKITISK